MVKSRYLLATARTYSHNKGRFLANFFTVFFAIALTGGLSAIPETFAESYAKNYSETNAPDLIIKSKAYTGFSKTEIESIQSEETVEGAEPFFAVDAKEDDGTYNRFYVFDFDTQAIGLPKVLKGALPANPNEILVEQGSKNRVSYAVGETVHITTSALAMFASKDLLVTGIADSPMYCSVAKERANLEDENDKQYIRSVFYINRKTIPHYAQQMEMYTDLYVRLKIEHNYLTEEYQKAVDGAKNALLSTYGENKIAILTLEQNTSYALYHGYTDKIRIIGYIFPFFFLAVCALINHITITRLIKDERPLLGVYSSAGISKGKLVVKYIGFIGIAVGLGAVFGYLIGVPLLPLVVYRAYIAVFQMNGCPISFLAPTAIVAALALLLLSVGISAYAALNYLKEEPSNLMRDKAPVPGKKILLERISWLWKAFPFWLKSSLRNIFRQKKNLILTMLSIIGSTLLVLIGLSLLNVSDALKEDELFSNVASSMGLISAVIVLFAVSMSVPVLYSLANMNVADRRRELATLKVLGYHDIQCLNYTFREIFMISILSVILGLPLSALIIDGVLHYLGFGSIADVQWWSYVLTAAIVLASMVGINYMLYPRIKAIDMCDSLKSNE